MQAPAASWRSEARSDAASKISRDFTSTLAARFRGRYTIWTLSPDGPQEKSTTSANLIPLMVSVPRKNIPRGGRHVKRMSLGWTTVADRGLSLLGSPDKELSGPPARHAFGHAQVRRGHPTLTRSAESFGSELTAEGLTAEAQPSPCEGEGVKGVVATERSGRIGCAGR